MAKKIIKVGGGETAFPVTENKAMAKTFRILALISWVVAIGFEIGAIFVLRKPPINTTWLIIPIIGALIFAVIGSLLWKRANRLDPASEKDKVKFFIQNQLGLLITMIAFLPLILLIFTSKNLSKKQKGLVGSIAIIAFVIAGITGIDFNPPSQEKYAQETEQVKSLTDGVDHVYWTKWGKSYHLYQDCPYINTERTEEIFEGTVAQAKELKHITDLCDLCARRVKKERGLTDQ